ncbi:uncharacterized protein L201_005736 [Kwoniella dendrophila CBS 6074]|uniref:Pericentrin/AKAP-450 centrosomal targeting domain-containing protein n=1 Tax=Kwoniella dendrophila CBS 6074 TaxID=1295534 RepID=A0AAX4K0V7_9TREE
MIPPWKCPFRRILTTQAIQANNGIWCDVFPPLRSSRVEMEVDGDGIHNKPPATCSQIDFPSTHQNMLDLEEDENMNELDHTQYPTETPSTSLSSQRQSLAISNPLNPLDLNGPHRKPFTATQEQNFDPVSAALEPSSTNSNASSTPTSHLNTLNKPATSTFFILIQCFNAEKRRADIAESDLASALNTVSLEQDKNQDLQQQLASSTGSEASFKLRFTQAQTERESWRKQWKQASDSLIETKGSLEKQIFTLNKSIESQRKLVSAQNERIIKLSGEISALQQVGTKTSLEETLKIKEKELEQLQLNIVNMEERKNADINDLESQKETLDKELEKLKEQLNNASIENQSLSDQVAAKDATIQTQLSQLETKDEQLQVRKTQLTTKIADCGVSIVREQALKTALEEKETTLVKEISQQKQELDTKQQDIASLQQQLKNLEQLQTEYILLQQEKDDDAKNHTVEIERMLQTLKTRDEEIRKANNEKAVTNLKIGTAKVERSIAFLTASSHRLKLTLVMKRFGKSQKQLVNLENRYEARLSIAKWTAGENEDTIEQLKEQNEQSRKDLKKQITRKNPWRRRSMRSTIKS